MLKVYGITVSEFQQIIKDYNNNQIEEMYEEYLKDAESTNELLPLIEDMTINQNKYMKELIDTFDKYKKSQD